MKKYMRLTYTAIFVVSLALFILGMFTFNKDIILSFIYDEGSDTFMDFTNSIRDAKDKTVYSEAGVIYPALPNCLFWLMAKAYPKELISVAFTDRYVIQWYWASIFWVALYVFLSFLLLFWILVLHEEKKNNKIFGLVLFFSLVFSMPMLWGVERGNTIIICVIFLIGFVRLRNDKSKIFREMSYVFLGIAVAIKIYPIVFILLLLFDKNYKGLCKSIVYTLILLMVPYVFYDGVYGLYYMLEAIFRFNDKHSSATVAGYCTSFYFFFMKLGINLENVSYNKVMVATDVIYLIVMVLSRRKWMKCAMLVFIIMNLSSSSIIYNSLYFMIPLSMLLSDEEKVTPYELVAFIPFALLIMPNAFEIPKDLPYSNLLWSNMVFPLMLVILAVGGVDSIVGVGKHFFGKKETSAVVDEIPAEA